MMTGANLEKTFKSGEKFNVPDVVQKEMQFFVQRLKTALISMDTSNYEQIQLSAETWGTRPTT